MNKIHNWINTGLIVLVAILVLVGSNQSEPLGASGTRLPNGISADSTSPSAGQIRGTTLLITGESQLRSLVSGDADGALPGITTSTVGAVTAAVLCDNSIVDITLPASDKNITFPSSTALTSDCLDTLGDIRRLVIHNASTSGNFTLVLSDSSSTIRTLTIGTSTPSNATTSLKGGDLATVEMVRGTSSSQPWVWYLVNVMR